MRALDGGTTTLYRLCRPASTTEVKEVAVIAILQALSA